MQIHTDGACSGNPGPGGWGWIAADGRTGSGGETQTTNQRMELLAVLEALRSVVGPIEIYSDSTYVVNCFKDRWYEGWKKRGWRNANKKPVANRDLWEPLIDLYLERQDEIQFSWVKGHSGDGMNEKADQLAVAAAVVVKEQIGSSAANTSSTISSLPAEYTGIAAPWPVERTLWAVGATELTPENRRQIEKTVRSLEPDSDVLLSGLRRGTELEAAEFGIRHGLKVAVVLPFEDPAKTWPADDKARFDDLIDAASWCVVLPGDKTQPGKAVEQRNNWMIETVIGAIVIGDETLSGQLDQAGITIVS